MLSLEVNPLTPHIEQYESTYLYDVQPLIFTAAAVFKITGQSLLRDSLSLVTTQHPMPHTKTHTVVCDLQHLMHTNST